MEGGTALSQARAERDRLRDEAAALRGVPAELARARAELERLRASAGWRATAPLRLAKRLAIRMQRSAARWRA